MNANGLPLDSAPLDLPVDARLSHADLRRFEPLQRVLLRPLDYETVDLWRAAVNEALMAATGGDAAMFQLMLPGLAPHYSDELQTEVLSGYPELMPDFERTKGIFRRSLRLGAGNRYLLWKHHLKWLYHSEYFNQMIVELRAFDTLWATAPVGNSQFPAMLHTYHDRRHRGPRFGAADVRLMHLLRPAIEAGVRTVVRTAASRASLTASLDAGRDGALVYSLDGRLLHRNSAVAALAPTKRDERTLVDAGREMTLGLAGGELMDLLTPSTVSRSVRTRTGEHALSAVRIGEGAFALRPVVLVTVGAGPAPLPDRDALRERFGLTRRQAEVARLLARRRTNDEIADELFISPHTARHHTEAVMGRLGVRDRRDVAPALRGGGDGRPVRADGSRHPPAAGGATRHHEREG